MNEEYDMNSKKNDLRSLLRNKRSGLSSIDQQRKSQLIINHILQSKLFKKSVKIGYYHAVRGEANPKNLSNSDTKKQFYLPVISKDECIALEFAPVTPQTQYTNNQFAIPEPVCAQSELMGVDELDLLFVPLLSFDKQGNRLGMGGGFYDRCLSFKQQQPKKKPILIGFSYDFQEVDVLQAEPWDIPLDGVATESGLRFMSDIK